MDLILLIAVLLALGALSVYLKRRRYRLPPGPRGLPIIGNAWDLPKEFEWYTYQKWSRDFRMCLEFRSSICSPVISTSDGLGSDLIHLEIFGTRVIVINSAKAANDLLDRRSTIYSDR